MDQPFAIGRSEITFAQWQTCVADKGCDGLQPNHEGWGGADVGHDHTVCRDCGSTRDGQQTAPVASFPANPFGLFDTSGNVWE
ncbi:MAG: SUMF1/EgtB/PvdO family nonheme iron enzyme [Rhodospirillales bacterium]|nr:SUMF1/EgtB/PvdO family nonheme iron enzyme [Rhodospirillales bacterium]